MPQQMMQLSEQTYEAWLKRAKAAAKSAAFSAEDVLFGRIAGPHAARPNHGPWQVLMRMDHHGVEKAERQALEDLDGGANGLVLCDAELAPALANLALHKVHLRNEAGDMGALAIQSLVAKLPLDPSRLAIDFGVTTLGVVEGLVRSGFKGPFMQADARNGHEIGLTAGQELGVVLAQVLAAFRLLENWDDIMIAEAISIKLIACQNAFETLAKFRAARVLWRQLLVHCKLPVVPLLLHGETSRLMLSDSDAHGNMMRGVAAVFGACLGGASSICALPFSQAQGTPNGFSRRVARNMQLVMLHEAALWRVDDPGAGAGAIENATRKLCEEAWDVLQKMERGISPRGDLSRSSVRPVIGVTAFQPMAPMPAEIEAVS